MRDYKHLTSFPREDAAKIKAATKATGLSINQIIIQSVRQQLPAILEQHRPPVDLSPIPDSVLAAALDAMTPEEIEEDAALSRASLKAQRG